MKLTNVNKAQTFREARNFLICALLSVQIIVSPEFWVPNGVNNWRKFEFGSDFYVFTLIFQFTLSLHVCLHLFFLNPSFHSKRELLTSLAPQKKQTWQKSSSCFLTYQQLNQETQCHCLLFVTARFLGRLLWTRRLFGGLIISTETLHCRF